MKLGKTSRLILAIGVFSILCISLGIVYSQQGQQQGQLSHELSLAEMLLTKYSSEDLTSRQEELESQLALAESQLETVKTSLTASVESIEASNGLMDIAEVCGVEVSGISALGLVREEIGGITYSVLPITAQVKGDLSSLVKFIREWTEEYPTGVVRTLNIIVPQTGGVSEGESVADINTFIYTYPGE